MNHSATTALSNSQSRCPTIERVLASAVSWIGAFLLVTVIVLLFAGVAARLLHTFLKFMNRTTQ